MWVHSGLGSFLHVVVLTKMVGEISVLLPSKVLALMSMVLPWLLLLLLATDAMMMRALTILAALELLPLLLSAELMSKMGVASTLLLLLSLSRCEAGRVSDIGGASSSEVKVEGVLLVFERKALRLVGAFGAILKNGRKVVCWLGTERWS